METHLTPSFTAKDFLSFLKNCIRYHPILTNLDFYLFNYAASVDSFRHDHTTFEWMVRTLATTHRLQFLIALLQFISSNPCPCADGIFSCPKLNLFSVSQLMLIAKLFKHFDKALEFYHRMIGERVKPDVITFNTLIAGYCKNSQMSLALQMFKEMKTHGCAPNVVSFNTLIKWFLLDGKIEEGIGMAYEMTEMGLGHFGSDIKSVLPRTFDYFGLVERLCGERNVAKAMELVHELWRNGNSPSLIACTTLIEGRAKEANKMRLLGLNKGLDPDSVTYNILISGFKREDKKMELEALVEEMLDLGFIPDIATYNRSSSEAYGRKTHCIVHYGDGGHDEEAELEEFMTMSAGICSDEIFSNVHLSRGRYLIWLLGDPPVHHIYKEQNILADRLACSSYGNSLLQKCRLRPHTIDPCGPIIPDPEYIESFSVPGYSRR
ncbi:hypothetical protein CQW23_18890 [Capsicum baccatum]|uniref:Pentatricopeptide repeat-containing protein n=1 Tax=Capsicum baccatum TaxID=33114 RepID=A0A2G2W477_CAPBA|nr:hypothetical protein CQW23_18890 [Capsicum baccatum]